MLRAEKSLLAYTLVFSLVLSCGDNGTEPANNPPNTPSNPSPVDGALNQPVDVDLSWECSDPDGDNLTYDIYFGTSSAPPLLQSGQTANTYDLGTLQMGTTYYWKVQANDGRDRTEGPTWSFTTPNRSPNAPSNPSPPNGSTDQPIDVDLSWECSDPDGDALTYALAMAGYPPDTIIGLNLTQPYFDPGSLNYGTIYAWVVLAIDEHSDTTSSEIWTFTTVAGSP